MSMEDDGCLGDQTRSAGWHKRAQLPYEDESLLGSPEKDLVSVDLGRVIGAQLNSSERARRCGMVLASSPSEKRIALSWISLQ